MEDPEWRLGAAGTRSMDETAFAKYAEHLGARDMRGAAAMVHLSLGDVARDRNEGQMRRFQLIRVAIQLQENGLKIR